MTVLADEAVEADVEGDRSLSNDETWPLSDAERDLDDDPTETTGGGESQ